MSVPRAGEVERSDAEERSASHNVTDVAARRIVASLTFLMSVAEYVSVEDMDGDGVKLQLGGDEWDRQGYGVFEGEDLEGALAKAVQHLGKYYAKHAKTAAALHVTTAAKIKAVASAPSRGSRGARKKE